MTKDIVQSFLDDFKVKMMILDIVFLNNRVKNAQTLALLEIPVSKQKQIIEELAIENYSEGPIEDTNFVGSPLWVFGKSIKGHELYIKISMGLPNRSTICISFHIAEFPINYPLK
ncbi:hypothetical protein LV89_01047 [Arcicella aurantiaca]|uniref:Toxin n=1 Tax=Arcicella aurantiaca TaxID=591202 RepID=A0A316ECL1_9BACT|nr:toxin [Arcicella aurantiaca]PWK28264.1 hypothetical protein LV89_01047 [Arcicella aurantiaca]